MSGKTHATVDIAKRMSGWVGGKHLITTSTAFTLVFRRVARRPAGL